MTIDEKDIPELTWIAPNFHSLEEVKFIRGWLDSLKSRNSEYKTNMKLYQLSSKQMKLNKRKLKKAMKSNRVKPVVSFERAFPVASEFLPTGDSNITLTATFKPE